MLPVAMLPTMLADDRRRAGWSVARAAHELGVSIRAYREIEAGRRSLRELLAAVVTVVIDEPTWTALDPELRTLVDIDEPGDLHM